MFIKFKFISYGTETSAFKQSKAKRAPQPPLYDSALCEDPSSENR